LPSYHEGLPIALLEALSFGLSVVISDIPANAELKLEPECYFPVGNVAALREERCGDGKWPLYCLLCRII